MRFLLDGKPLGFRQGDTVLTALLRNGEHPTGGGCLCFGGDCPSCLATVNGLSYVRTCQVPARPGLTVERHPQDGLPLLPPWRLERPQLAIVSAKWRRSFSGIVPQGRWLSRKHAKAGERLRSSTHVWGRMSSASTPGRSFWRAPMKV